MGMIHLDLAKKLKQNGLQWQPALHDFFAIPDRGMDNRVFVISDMLANIEKLLGSQVVAFQGASEWALDYLVTSEAVWIPSDDQLRQHILERLPAGEGTAIRLDCTPGGCICRLQFQQKNLDFRGEDAGQSYGLALLHILEASHPEQRGGDEPGPDVWEQWASSGN
jgi:hypothetical protein